MTSLFALILLVQAPASSIPVEAQDWAFMVAQEQTVIDWTPRGNENFLRAMPFEVAREIIGLGHWRSKFRDYHKDILRKMGPSVAPWLVHGIRIDDPEIRFRCDNLLREFSTCRECGGRGQVGVNPWEEECRTCRGAGRFYPMEMFD